MGLSRAALLMTSLCLLRSSSSVPFAAKASPCPWLEHTFSFICLHICLFVCL